MNLGGRWGELRLGRDYVPSFWPLFAYDPIFNSVTDEKARMRMVSSFDLENTKPDWALCYRFDIVLRGRNATPLDSDDD